MQRKIERPKWICPVAIFPRGGEGIARWEKDWYPGGETSLITSFFSEIYFGNRYRFINLLIRDFPLYYTVDSAS